MGKEIEELSKIEELGKAVENLEEEIFKALYIPQICAWFDKFWRTIIGNRTGC